MALMFGTVFRRSVAWALFAILFYPVIASYPANATDHHTGPVLALNAADLERARLGIEKLQTWYNPDTGLWRTTHWWNAANSVTVLVNYSVVSRSPDYLAAIDNTFERNASSGFLNYYYDDEGWWALAWIRAYDWTRDPKYLEMSKYIFQDMTIGWDDVCSGGIWWSKDRNYKNAIANELFLSVAASLANRVSDPNEQALYLSWAQSEWDWFQQSGMINADNLINDGLNSSCLNNGGNIWSYNQGVILGGLVELYGQTQDPDLPGAANSIARAAIAKLCDSYGILHDRCEPRCGADGVQFKRHFRRIDGHANLWALAAILGRETKSTDQSSKEEVA